MFTSQAPYLLSALGDAVGGEDARRVTQALANCSQDLTHRGSVQFASTPFSQTNGVVNDSPWNTAINNNYYGDPLQLPPAQDMFRPGGGLTYVNMLNTPIEFPPPGGYRSGDWYTYMGDNNFFDVAPRITETTNQYYGGPTFQVAGDSHFTNTYTNNSYTNNSYHNTITTQEINGVPVRGDKGDPGAMGNAGLAGQPGPPGNNGNPGLAGPAGAAGLNGLDGLDGMDPRMLREMWTDIRGLARWLKKVEQDLAALTAAVNNLEGKLVGPITVGAVTIGPITATLNPDCTITVDPPTVDGPSISIGNNGKVAIFRRGRVRGRPEIPM